MITPAAAEKLIFTHLAPFHREDCPLAQAHGRVLRGDVCADRDLPPFDRVTMDGYALRAAALAAGVTHFRVEGVQAAGMRPFKLGAAADACIEIIGGVRAATRSAVGFEHHDVQTVLHQDARRIQARKPRTHDDHVVLGGWAFARGGEGRRGRGRDAAQNRADIEFGLKTIGDNCLEEGEHFSTMVRRRAIEAKLMKDMAEEYDVPLWMIIKPTNVALQDITGEEPKEAEGEEVDVDEDLDEKSSADVSVETQTEKDDAESDELEDPQG